MKKFIFRGIYYPVVGSKVGWCNNKTMCVMERRLGGWKNADKWWSFSYGIHVRLFDTEKPYKQCIVDAIDNHRDMVICKNYFDSNGYGTDDVNSAVGYITVVRTKSGEYLGSIRDAYALIELTDLTRCTGWNEKEQKAYGWSHRAKVGFGIGDKLFDENYGDGSTLYTEHGSVTIQTKEQAIESAARFAASVS